jgi:hypothetical protein
MSTEQHQQLDRGRLGYAEWLTAARQVAAEEGVVDAFEADNNSRGIFPEWERAYQAGYSPDLAVRGALAWGRGNAPAARQGGPLRTLTPVPPLPGHWRRRDWVLLAVVTAVAFLLPLRALLGTAGAAMEEGFMLVFPEQVLRGEVPNKDFLYLYGPGALWVLAGIYKVFGVAIHVERIVGLLQLVGMALGVAVIVRWWGRWVAVGAVLSTVLFVTPSLQLVAIPWTGGAALALFALAALLQARYDASDRAPTRGTDPWPVVGGVLAGLAMLYRLDLGLALTLGGAAALWGLPAATVRRALTALAVGLSPYLVHLALAGPLTVFRGMVSDPMLRMRATRGLPLPPDPNELEGVSRAIGLVDRSWPLPRLTPPQQLFLWFVLLAVVTVAVLAVAAWAVRRDPTSFRSRVLLAGALFAIGMYPQALQRADSAHFAWVSVVVVALVPAAVVEVVSVVRPPWSLARVGPLASVLVIVATALLLPTYTARRYVALVEDSIQGTDAATIRHDGRSFHVGGRDFARRVEALLDEVDRQVPPGGRVIVGNTDLRRVPYNDSFLYHLLPRFEPGTYSIEFEPALTNRRGTTLTEEMERADAFIASDRWLTWEEPNDSMAPGDPGPAQVLRSRFCLERDFGAGYKLFLPCPGS